MNKRQRTIIRDFTTIICVTVVAVAAMVSFKDWVNRSEAMRAMQQLGQIVLQHRNKVGSVPPKSYIDDILKDLEGSVRLGSLQYRARWIDFDAGPDEILAYAEKSSHSFIVGKGVIVLRLDGRVEWMDTDDFQSLLEEQQGPMEKQLLQK